MRPGTRNEIAQPKTYRCIFLFDLVHSQSARGLLTWTGTSPALRTRTNVPKEYNVCIYD